MYSVETVKDRIVKLNVGDWIGIQKWMKRQPVDDAIAVTMGLSVEIQNAAIREATQLATKVTMTSPEGFDILTSPMCAMKLLHLTLQKSESNLKIEQVTEQVSLQDLEPILNLILEVNGFFKGKDVKNEETAK